MSQVHIALKNKQDQYPNRILRMRQLTAKVPYAPSTIYGLVATGKFPAPFKLIPGGRAAGWLESDIDTWLQAQLTKRATR